MNGDKAMHGELMTRAGTLLLAAPKRRQLPKTKDPFKILGVSQRASLTTIKKAYRELCREFHPDRNPTGKEDFQRVNDAYHLIMSGNGIGRLIAKCEIVPLKQEQAQVYATIKRAMVLAGIKPQIPSWRESFRIQKQMGDKWDDVTKFQNAVLGRCPKCRYKEQCDRVTGWDDVAAVYNEIYSDTIKRTVESFFDSLLGAFDKKGGRQWQ